MADYVLHVRPIQPASTGKGNLLPVTGLYLLEQIETLKQHGIPVYRVLKDSHGEFRADPVDLQALVSLPIEERTKKNFLINKEWKSKLFASLDTFDAQLEPLLDQSPQERSEAVHALKVALAELKATNAEPMVKVKVIMDFVPKTFLLNKASLKLKPQDMSPYDKSLTKDTEGIVSTVLEMASDPALVSGLFSAFQDLSNGQTLNHVFRVFSSFNGFLHYYNQLHQLRLPQTLRKVFPKVYLDDYRRLLPKVESHWMVSDHVLQLSSFSFLQMKEFSLGAFLHDIGKMGNLDYFESDAAYDAQQIRQHVFLSAGLILMNFGNEHSSARLLAGDHHNGLGHPGGYGLTRLEIERSQRAPMEIRRCLSSSADGFTSGEALGFLPVEMLAVTDVYDAMIDTSRAYKKAMSPSQAVVFLEETMVAEGKLDPVLVDLYVDFLRVQGVEVPDDRGFTFKIARE